MPDGHVNFGWSTIVGTTSANGSNAGTAGLNITITAGDATKFASAIPCNAVVYPAGGQPTDTGVAATTAEIVRITAIGNSTLTIQRLAEAYQATPTARNILSGDIIEIGVTVKTLTDVESGLASVALATATLSARNFADLGYFVESGCLLAPDATPTKLDLAVGVACFGAKDVSVVAQTAISTTITSLAPTTSGYSVWVSVDIDSSNTVHFNSGTAALFPAFPAITVGHVPLGWLWIPYGATQVDTNLLVSAGGNAKLLDARIVRVGPGSGWSVATDTAWTFSSLSIGQSLGGQTTVAAGSNNVHTNTFLGEGTLALASTTIAAPSGGIAFLLQSSAAINLITYTGVYASGSLVGCTLTTGSDVTMATGNVVVLPTTVGEYVFTVAADVTGYIEVGTKIKALATLPGATPTSEYIYGVVVKVAFSAGTSTITMVTPNSQQDISGSLTSILFSNVRKPFGFPVDPNLWEVKLAQNTTPSPSTTADGSYHNVGNYQIKIPNGIWRTTMKVPLRGLGSATTTADVNCALSTSTSSVSDTDLLQYIGLLGAPSSNWDYRGPIYNEKVLNLTSDTSYYLILAEAGVTTLAVDNATGGFVLRAYLELL